MSRKLGTDITINKRIRRWVIEKPEYKAMKLKRYSENPLIEALDFNLTEDQVFKELAKLPYHQERDSDNKISIGDYSAKEKSLLSVALTDCCYPDRELWFKLYTDITDLILDSYVSRVPESAEHNKHKTKLAAGTKKDNMKYLYRNSCLTCSKTGVLSGLSGIGKTFITESILSLIPNVIYHSKYKGRRVRFAQVTWMKIECPPSGTIKGICLSILAMFDYLLGLKGDDCFFQSGSYLKSDDELQLEVALLASVFNLGALVIDDAENMMNNEEREKLTAFLNSLVNCVGIFVVYVGTSRLRFLFTSEQTDEFRTARRLGTGFFEELKNYDSDNKFWNSLVKLFWVNLLVQEKTDLSEKTGKNAELDYKSLIYDYTRGVPAILAYFMFRCNRYIVRHNSLKITKSILDAVYNEDMIPLHDGIDALRIGDFERYNDLCLISNFIFEEVPSMDDSKYKERVCTSIPDEPKKPKKAKAAKGKKDKKEDVDLSRIQEKINIALNKD